MSTEGGSDQMGDNESFAFRTLGPNTYAVVHHPTNLTWQFEVEKPQPLFLRSLMPKKTPTTPTSTKATSGIRRSAFQFAVTEARKLGLID